MLPLEAVKVSSELLRPLARRFMPQALARFLGRLGVRMGQWSRATQARLPEPVVLCIKLLAATAADRASLPLRAGDRQNHGRRSHRGSDAEKGTASQGVTR